MKTKLRNKWVSKLMALCLTAVMVLSMGMTASAEVTPTESKNVTVDGLDEGTTVSIYKVIEVNVNNNGQPENPMYTWTDGMAAWLKNNTNETYKTYIDENTNAVAEAFQKGTTAEAFRSFWHDVEAAIQAAQIDISIAYDDQIVAAGQTSATFTDVGMGEYLLSAKGGVKIYQPTTVLLVPSYNKEKNEWILGDATVGTDTRMKGEQPPIEKTVQDGDNTVAVGDTVTFVLNATVPSYPEDATYKKFIISDKLGTGLVFKGSIDKNSIKVSSDVEGNNTINQSYYGVQPNWISPETYEKRTFAVIFNNNFFENSSTIKNVYVTYQAEVTADAFMSDPSGTMVNDAFLGYNNDPYTEDGYKENPTDKKVYTYEIDLTKVDSEGIAIKENSATFQLKTGDTLLYFTGSKGVYTYNSSNTVSTAGATADLVTDSDGSLKIKGLDAGTYTLLETKAPDGYVLPNGSIEIIIQDQEPDGTIDKVSSGNVTASGGAALNGEVTISDNSTTISFKVQNTSSDEAGFTLPTTGGMGTMIFTIAGILIMGGAVALIVVAARKKRG